MTTPEILPPAPPTAEERLDRYATAISKWHRDPEQRLYTEGAEAVVAVADVELRAQRDRQAAQTTELLNRYADLGSENTRLRGELETARAAATPAGSGDRYTAARQAGLDVPDHLEPAAPPVPPVGDLAQQLADAICGAVHDCDGDCGLTDEQCNAAYPIQPSVLHGDEVAAVDASIDALVAVVLPVVQAAEAAARGQTFAAASDTVRDLSMQGYSWQEIAASLRYDAETQPPAGSPGERS
jgi:hypothetical protein